jgi:AcrR family transcriptional regulator
MPDSHHPPTPAPTAPPPTRSTHRRSDASRAAILTAARERFAADGYERATIRGIAADARIDPAMVIRYFGTKAQLFALASEIDLHMPDPASIPRDRAGEMLTAHFFVMWERSEALAAMLRAAATNEEAAENSRRIFSEQVRPIVEALCPDEADVPVRAGLIAGQLLGAALVRYLVRFPPLAALDLPTLTDWLAPTIQRYLTAERP